MTTPTRTMLVLALAMATLGAPGTAFGQRRKAQGQAMPQPSLQSVFPAGVGAGGMADVTIRGTDLEGATTLWFDHPGLRAFHLKGTTFRVVCATGTTLGHHDVRAVGTYGVTNPRTFVVGDRPEAKEAEPNSTPDKANPVSINSVVNGEIGTATDVDCFAFEAKKGQRILFDLEAERIDSRLDESRDAYGADPFLDVTIPADGTYLVKVHDVIYKGSSDHPYRLTVTDGPHLDAVVPVLARAGEETTFTLIGRNLGGEPAPELSIEGRPLETKTVKFTPPRSSGLDSPYPSRGFVSSSGAARRGFEYAIKSPSGSSNAVFIAESTDPVVLEIEPNDDAGHAQSVTVPCDISGTFGAAGDVDLYRFRAKKGEVFWIEASAERLGSPADPLFAVQKIDEKGVAQDVASAEDTPDRGGLTRFHTGTVDASVRWSASDDGLYQVAASDLFTSQRGDARLSYRLSIRPERPDFHLFLLPESLNQPDSLTLGAGGRSLAYVLVVRLDGFSGPVRVEASDLPPGVHCEPVVIGAGQAGSLIVFEADEGAQPFLGTVRLEGRARFGDRKNALQYVTGVTPLGPDLTHEAVGGGIVWPMGAALPGGGQPMPQARVTRGFVLKVIDTAPLALTARLATRTATPGGVIALDLSVTRRAGFTEAVVVSLLTTLPGLGNNPPTFAIPKTATTGTYALTLPKTLSPGVYTMVLQGAGPYPFSKDANAKNKPNVNLAEPSNPVTLVVRPAPGAVAVNTKGGSLKVGGTLEIEVTVTRQDGSKAPVNVSLAAPTALKLSAAPVVAEPGKAMKLVVKAAADSPPGAAAGIAVRATIPVRGEPVDVDAPAALTIAK
jgi:hypothetical protein